MLDLNLIRTDGGTQSRVKLDEGIVAEYAEAYKAGATFPAVTVFFDGSDRWLADGFHRYFGAKAAGKKTILETVIPGTLRDAKLFSYGANGKHGQRPTNADKRKAVEEMLADAEWSQWSDRKIAEACGVSIPFVGAIRRPEVAEKQKQNRAKSATKEAAGCNPITPPAASPAAPLAPKPTKVDPEDIEYFGPSQEEMDAAVEEAKQDVEALQRLLDADDKLAALAAENAQLRAELAVVKVSRDGYMNRSNELIDRVKWLKRKLAKAEASNV